MAKILKRVACSYCYLYVGWNYVVHFTVLIGPSMSPTINSENGSSDIALAEHISRLTRRMKLNDVVVLIDPEDAGKSICKRITAMEGDKIPNTAINSCGHSRVPRGHVWLEGDNKEDSYDSRMFGPVPKALIRSRVFYKVWPLSKLGPISAVANRVEERVFPYLIQRILVAMQHSCSALALQVPQDTCD